MNAYKVIWNYEIKFSNSVIHLGDFHFIKENVQVSKTWLFKQISVLREAFVVSYLNLTITEP